MQALPLPPPPWWDTLLGAQAPPPGMALLNLELEKADGNLDLLQTT